MLKVSHKVSHIHIPISFLSKNRIQFSCYKLKVINKILDYITSIRLNLYLFLN